MKYTAGLTTALKPTTFRACFRTVNFSLFRERSAVDTSSRAVWFKYLSG